MRNRGRRAGRRGVLQRDPNSLTQRHAGRRGITPEDLPPEPGQRAEALYRVPRKLPSRNVPPGWRREGVNMVRGSTGQTT